MRLAGISLLAAGVAVALYVVGRVHRVNPASSLFGLICPELSGQRICG
jgi:hypothetical protein